MKKKCTDLSEYEHHINRKFNRYLEDIYYQEEELKKEKRLREIEKEIEQKL